MDISLFSPTVITVLVIIICLCIIPVFSIVKKKSNTTNKLKNIEQNANGNGGINISGVAGNVNIHQGDDKYNSQISESDYDYNINILFIDDEEKTADEFQLIKLLASYGYTNTHLVHDSQVVSPEVCSAKIVFVDITGVGKHVGCNDGTELAVQIKKRYGKDKIVAIYSSTETHNIQVKGLNTLDGIFGKNDDFQLYLDFIEPYAKRN